MSDTTLLVLVGGTCGVLGSVVVLAMVGIERLRDDMGFIEPTATVGGQNIHAIYRRQIARHQFVVWTCGIALACLAAWLLGVLRG